MQLYGNIVTGTTVSGARRWQAILEYTTSTYVYSYGKVVEIKLGKLVIKNHSSASLALSPQSLAISIALGTQTFSLKYPKKDTTVVIQAGGTLELYSSDFGYLVYAEVTRTDSTQTATVSVRVVSTATSWSGTSSGSTSVTIPSTSAPLIEFDANRCNIDGTLNDKGDYILASMTVGGDTNKIKVTPTFTQTVTQTRISTGSISSTWLDAPATIYVEESQNVYHALLKHSYDNTDHKFLKTVDYGIKLTASFPDTDYADVNITVTFGKDDSIRYTATVTVNDTVPFIRSDGTSSFNEIKLYNYTTNAYDVVEYGGGLKVVQTGASQFKFSIDVEPKYVSSLTEESPDIKIQYKYDTHVTSSDKSHTAFYSTTKNMSYSNGLANCMFLGGCTEPNYTSRVWYSYVNNPLYFPDNNFIEVGSNDTAIMGLCKVGEYLGIIKQGKTTDTSIYIAYPTSFEEDTAYAIKPSVNGIGACARYAFNVLGDETLFLSDEGVMAISFSETDTDKQVKNRSYYIDGQLLKEEHLEKAYSFVWKGFYLLAVPHEADNGRIYILDGSQRNSWGNDRTNLVYECYFWNNVPAKSFAKYRGSLWFTDGKNMCRFKKESDPNPYNDNGAAICAEWSTIYDDDGSSHYTKTMQKKGSKLSLAPSETGTSCDVYARVDNGVEQYIGSANSDDTELPVDFYFNKKVKKYKRMQIIVRNDVPDQSFGISQIVKLYTLGNYSK